MGRLIAKEDINPPRNPFVVHLLVLCGVLTGNPLLLMNLV